MEFGADEATVAVGAGDLAPDGLVRDASVVSAGSVDVADALSVVPLGGVAVRAALHGEKGLMRHLGALTTSEAHESGFLIKSIKQCYTHFKAITSLVDVSYVSWLERLLFPSLCYVIMIIWTLTP